jgi:O-antigen/teichoic acid export membrane protein
LAINKILIISTIALAPYTLVFAMQIIFARYLTVAEIGQFALVNFLLMLFMTSTNWGVDRYIISNKKITKDTINEIFTQELIFSLIIYLVCITLFRDNINNYAKLDDSSVFWALLLCIFVYNPLSRTKAVLEKKMLFLPAYLPGLTAHFFGCSVGFMFLNMGYGIWSMVAWKMTVLIIEYVILLLFASDRPKFNFQFENFNTHIVFCFPLFLGGLISFFSVTADIWIVNNLLGSFELGLYWLAFSASHLVLSVRTLINRMLLPLLSQTVSPEEKIELFSRLNGFLQVAVVGVAVLVSYWGGDAFVLVFGEKWSEAGQLFLVLFYAVAFKVVSGTANSLLHAFMKTGIDLNVALINGLILIPLLVVFTYFGGVLGASIAVLVSTIVMTVYVYEVYVRKVCNLGFLYFFSYLSINLVTLICINIVLSEYLDDIMIRLSATGSSILIAYLTLRMPSICFRVLILK